MLAIRPDQPPPNVEAVAQTENELGEAAGLPAAAPDAQIPEAGLYPQRPLIYAALLGQKSEATESIKGLLAKVNDDHASLPHTIFFRLHSDRGTEFVNQELNSYCRQHAIHQTTTQGNDPNANATAERAVGVLKRRCRYLLTGARLPTRFWGVGVLAAAQLERADAGMGEYPRIPFGTRNAGDITGSEELMDPSCGAMHHLRSMRLGSRLLPDLPEGMDQATDGCPTAGSLSRRPLLGQD